METFLAPLFGHSILKRSHRGGYRQSEEFMAQKIADVVWECSRKLALNDATVSLETR